MDCGFNRSKRSLERCHPELCRFGHLSVEITSVKDYCNRQNCIGKTLHTTNAQNPS